uniref:Uncharacterized protein n=2 Tax=Percolomonas cosmopolitus TaxID=63605 RepID=A0A7S1KRF5_9EUKA|mmetsp:Transcript_6268/g.23561  ORF Transcript_6268/g.23561 Transcript_6268/m.23561 type:complete len:250 (+) Transcript_6268:323-1072(+)|eukprot:CAMPEP_0117442574 /NCGR_PEP_ID=MMETSP0759-20121206/4225_1 /TAXON_ID=63605 /ORGANISM="Percolomonas cosmopolitus, Strain WS" /LENGTH=249 /DNA_ID=CAMNT_0005234473 /DNA_START=276 /DNA_END=1025 /DNA_ORIENTATION=+
MIILGKTHSGKTTFLKSLLSNVPIKEEQDQVSVCVERGGARFVSKFDILDFHHGLEDIEKINGLKKHITRDFDVVTFVFKAPWGCADPDIGSLTKKARKILKAKRYFLVFSHLENPAKGELQDCRVKYEDSEMHVFFTGCLTDRMRINFTEPRAVDSVCERLSKYRDDFLAALFPSGHHKGDICFAKVENSLNDCTEATSPEVSGSHSYTTQRGESASNNGNTMTDGFASEGNSSTQHNYEEEIYPELS